MKALRFKSIIVTILLLLLVGMIPFGFSACQRYRGRNFEKDPLTIEEIEEYTRQKCFDENGNAYKYLWEQSNPVIKDKRIWEYNGEDITGFTVHWVNGFDEDPGWFLVEFEPLGHYFSNIYRGYDFFTFEPFPSPFKVLNIPYEEAYVASYSNQAPKYGKKQYGLIFSVYAEAYADTYVPITYYPQYNSFGDEEGFAYDQSLKKWIDLGIEHDTGRLYRLITDPKTGEESKKYIEDYWL